MKRRDFLAAGPAALLAGCGVDHRALQGGWVGAGAARGHRLREKLPAPGDGPLHRARVLIVGGGVAGLSCARALLQAGIDDIALLELEDEVGGNARGHSMGGMACPLGAHYLPLPGPDAPEVYRLLEELGLVRQQLGRPVYDERNLCHSPQERLFFDGQWVDGLLPPARGEATRAQYLRFAQAVAAAQKELGFSMPTHRARWRPGHARLDAQTFAAWLDGQGLDDVQLRWYLDYCCRDDFGATAATVSAWAGLHYFASRHGFHPPGFESEEREAVLTWPEGNAWLTRRLAPTLGERQRTGRTVLRIREERHAVQLLAWNEAAGTPERWEAQQVVLATPLFIGLRLLEQPPETLRQAAADAHWAPWLVANLQTREALLDRPGVALAWDNVSYGSTQALGYVDARHQGLSPMQGPGLLTAYWTLPEAQRGGLLREDWATWSARVVTELARTHADLPDKLLRIDLMRYGHAMSIPTPGRRGNPALNALATQAQGSGGRLHFAHGDLAAYSVFEEAFTQGQWVAQRLLRKA